MPEKEKILVVDDDASLLQSLYNTFTKHNFSVDKAASGEEALNKVKSVCYDLVVTDLMMENIDGITLLKEIKQISPDVVVIVISGHGSIEIALEATKFGAYDFVPKPFGGKEILLRVNRGLEFKRKDLERELLSKKVREKYSFHNIISKDPKMLSIFKQVEEIAQTDAIVLITGETGTGKELIANAIHYSSHRKDGPFMVINCATISETLLESELFGHEKGAFTGAFKQKKGKFEIANGGSVFLDEIGDVPLVTQVKLLRILQEKKFERVGGTETLETDIRIIAATNRDLIELIEKGLFREDLYYRLNVFPIHLPALRERKDDIPLLIDYFLRKLNQKIGKNTEKVSEKTLQGMLDYSWPGNIRELENILERAILVSKGKVIESVDFVPAAKTGRKGTEEIGDMDYNEFQKKFFDPLEKEYLINMINKYVDVNSIINGIGISERTFYYRLKKHGINLSSIPRRK